MLKNTVIATLTAVLVVQAVPWFAAGSAQEKAAIRLGIFAVLIFFCIFCEEMAEKLRERHRRRERLEELIKDLRRRRQGGTDEERREN